jgi:hypothetical protein
VGDELLDLLGGRWGHPHPTYRVAIGDEPPVQQEHVEGFVVGADGVVLFEEGSDVYAAGEWL